MIKYKSQDYLFKNIPHWIRLIVEFIIVLFAYILLANLGITNYRHEMNHNFVSITGYGSIITGLIIGVIYVLYNLTFNNKIVEEIYFDDENQNIAITYINFFIKRRKYNILYRNLRYEYRKELGFKYYDYVLKLIDLDKKKFKIKTKKFGWEGEIVKSLENDLKSRTPSSA